MQNIIRSNRQCVGSQRFLGYLFKYNLNKYKIFNTAFKNIDFNNRIDRLYFAFPHQFYKKKCKELTGMQLLFSKDGLCKIYFSKFNNTRNLNTSSKNPQQSSEDDDKRKEIIASIISTFMICFLVTAFIKFLNDLVSSPPGGISWNDFVNELLLKGQVQEIRIYPSHLKVILKKGATFYGRNIYREIDLYNVPNVKLIEDRIRGIEKHLGIAPEDGIPIKYVYLNNEKAIVDFLLIMGGLFAVIWLFRHTKITSAVTNHFKINTVKYTLVEPSSGKNIYFKDVIGLHEAKVEVMEFVDYLKNPQNYTKLGAKVPKGALLLGPPGCGKTLLAKAVATESNVPFLSMNGSEFIEIIGGVGASRVRDLFAAAKKRAPSIIYIDEIDAIGRKRTDTVFGAQNELDRTLNQLLVEMDGMTEIKDVIILASTNRADVLDKALLRAGRFDRHILISLPTLEERTQIFEYYLQQLTLEGKPTQYAKYLAHITPGFSGAEIANVCNEAALHAANEKKAKVDNDDLMFAVDKVLSGTRKKSSTLTTSEKEIAVYHEAGHAVAAWLLEHANPLIKVTVVPRTNKRLGTSQYVDSNLKLRSSTHLFEQMCVLLAGRVAENIMFNITSSNAKSDLEKVTKMAYHQVQQFGMSPSVGLISFNQEYTSTKTKKLYSKKLGQLMDAEVRRIITEVYKTTEKLLQDNKDKLIILAEELMKKETLTHKDIEALIGPSPFGKKILTELQ